jgi:hypothetical protein
MRRRVTITTPPAVEPVALPEARLALGLDAGSDAPVIMQHIESARELAEKFTGRTFITTVLCLHLERFPASSPLEWWDGVREGVLPEYQSSITLTRPPAQAITSVTYTDSAGTSRTVDSGDYYLAGDKVILTPGSMWPSGARLGTVQVTYAAGYGDDPEDVPATIRSAILAHVRDAIERPNAAISSETIDNASVVYGAQRLGSASGSGPDDAGGLRGGAAAMLAAYRTPRVGG